MPLFGKKKEEKKVPPQGYQAGTYPTQAAYPQQQPYPQQGASAAPYPQQTPFNPQYPGGYAPGPGPSAPPPATYDAPPPYAPPGQFAPPPPAATGYQYGAPPPSYSHHPPPQGPQTVVVQGGFDANARFDNISTARIPPPPPGCAPNAAQIAVAQGHNVQVSQQSSNWFTGGGADAGINWGL